ncbi:MAG: hypothetical protein K2N23_02845 [Clostridia bacterium]|nr:hypothetical protein [Clostridia bacterium]
MAYTALRTLAVRSVRLRVLALYNLKIYHLKLQCTLTSGLAIDLCAECTHLYSDVLKVHSVRKATQ